MIIHVRLCNDVIMIKGNIDNKFEDFKFFLEMIIQLIQCFNLSKAFAYLRIKRILCLTLVNDVRKGIFMISSGTLNILECC